MMNTKRLIPAMMAAALVCTSLPMTVQADGAKIVTIGANLTEEQKQSMYQYFGTTADAVDTIEVTNADERKYMEGIASEAQIGTRTYSCSYVEPTTSGGIQVKVGNLTFVTSSMIASTLLTSGVENCNVVAASPMEVSGTGALTGIMMAYEKASGETLSEDQKAAATEELITTGEIADTIGQKDATDLINEVKQEVIKEGLTDEGEIKEAVNNAVKNYNISLTEDQLAKINSLMKNISQYDYDVKALKETLDNLDGKSGGFFSNLWTSVKGFFTGDSNNDGGIINGTNDDILGADAVIDSTLDAVVNDSKEEGGFWDKVTGFFKNLFGGGDDEAENEDTETAGTEDATEDTDDSDGSDDASADDENPDASIDPETGSPVDPETGLPINDADNTDSVSEGSDAVLENQTNGTTDSTVNDAENNDSASDITQ
ncbi:DUF1002 domain-containing protein [Lachnospiraceae bacterium 62-26]